MTEPHCSALQPQRRRTPCRRHSVLSTRKTFRPSSVLWEFLCWCGRLSLSRSHENEQPVLIRNERISLQIGGRILLITLHSGRACND